MSEKVVVEISDHIATVRLNRPEKYNAIDLDLFTGLTETGRQLANNNSVRAVVLHGAGENFCAGIDTSAFAQMGGNLSGEGRMDPLPGTPANFFQACAYVWREVPVPVIAAVQGVSFGAGVQIALGADIRYARPDARISIMEIKWGIIPDLALTTTAHHIMATDRLKELSFSGRVISGDEALDAGLVTAVKEDPLAAAHELAAEIAGKNPHAIRAMKSMIDRCWHPDDASMLRCEAELQSSLIGTRNQMEAVMANMEKRAPEFDDC